MVSEHETASPHPPTAVLDALNIAAAVLDRTGRIVAVNGRLLGLLERCGEGVVGTALSEFGHVPAGDAALDGEAWRACDPFELEFEVVTPDGVAQPVLASGGPILCDGERMVTFQPLARLRRHDQQLQNRYTELSRLSDVILEQALDLKHYSSGLEEMVRWRTAELHAANMDAIYMLAIASEEKDHDTGAHVRRIETYARRVAHGLGMNEEDAERVGYSAVLHDVGKFHIPDHVLKKPGGLTPAERELVESHTIAGERILGSNPFFETARYIARSHHENWDGSGYPDGLTGAQIPLPARIVHLVDVYDALTSDRVYKLAWDEGRATGLIREGAGRLFDPELARVFEELHARHTFERDVN